MEGNHKEILVDMKIFSFFIHGTPSSKCSTSKALFNGIEERLFEEFFSGNNFSSIDTYLVYETREWDEFVCSVYTFYNKVRGIDNRVGCYCALTLIVKYEVCLEFDRVFSFFQRLYKNELQENLGMISKDGKFNVDSFDNNFAGLESIEKKVRVFLEVSDFEPIDNRFHISNYSPTPECFNLSEIKSDEFLGIVLKVGKVFVSDQYQTKKEKEAIEQKERTKEEKNGLNISDNIVINESYSNSNSIDEKDVEQEIRTLTKKYAELHQEKHSNVDNHTIHSGFVNTIRALSLFEWLSLINFVLLCFCLYGIFGRNQQLPSQTHDIQNAIEKSSDSPSSFGVKGRNQ